MDVAMHFPRHVIMDGPEVPCSNKYDSCQGRSSLSLSFTAEPPGLVSAADTVLQGPFGQHSSSPQAATSSSYASKNTVSGLTCSSSLCSTVPQHTADAAHATPHGSVGDTCSYYGSTEPLQRSGDLTLADILSAGRLPAALQSESAEGQAPQLMAPLPLATGGSDELLPSNVDMLLAHYLQQEQPTVSAAFNMTSFTSDRPSFMDSFGNGQYVLDQFLQQAGFQSNDSFSVPIHSSSFTAGIGDSQGMLSSLTPSATLPPSAAMAAMAANTTPHNLTPAERLQLQLLQQQNALLQQQLLQQQQQAQEQQFQQQRIQQQLQLLLQQQQLSQQVKVCQTSEFDMLTKSFPSLTLSGSSDQLLPADQQSRQATATNQTAMLAAQLAATFNSGKTFGIKSGGGGINTSVMAAAPAATEALLLGGMVPSQQLPFNLGINQAALLAAAGAAGLPAGAYQAWQQRCEEDTGGAPTCSSAGFQASGTGVFIRRVSSSSLAGASTPDAEKADAAAAAHDSSPRAYGRSASSNSSTSDRSQTDQGSKRNSIDWGRPNGTALASDAASTGSRQCSFDGLKPINKADARCNGVGLAAGGRSRGNEIGVVNRRSLSSRSAADSSGSIVRCAPKWASEGWDPKAQLAGLGSAAQKGTGAFIPGAGKPGTGAFIPHAVREVFAAAESEESDELSAV